MSQEQAESKELAVHRSAGKSMEVAIAPSGNLGSLAPKTIEEAMTFCNFLAKSNVIPKDFIGKPENIFVAVQWGMEIGLAPMQAMQNIAIINGRPSLWGDAMLALVMSSPVFGSIEESIEGEGDAAVAICRVNRKGGKVHEQRFSVADAKAADLLGKQGPWKNYRSRMMQMRARSWALRDTFPDVLKGMPCAEEVQDYEVTDYTVIPSGGKPQVSAPQSTKNLPAESGTAAETKPQEPQLINPGGVALLKRSLDAKNIPYEVFCEFMGIKALEDLPSAKLTEAMNAIKQDKIK